MPSLFGTIVFEQDSAQDRDAPSLCPFDGRNNVWNCRDKTGIPQYHNRPGKQEADEQHECQTGGNEDEFGE